MKPPIIISENGDIYFYTTLEEAERDIEPPDVSNGIYVIYDSEGLVLTPTIVDDPIYDVIKIIASEESRPIELMKILTDFFSEAGHDLLMLDTMTLEELINLGSTIFR